MKKKKKKGHEENRKTEWLGYGFKLLKSQYVMRLIRKKVEPFEDIKSLGSSSFSVSEIRFVSLLVHCLVGGGFFFCFLFCIVLFFNLDFTLSLPTKFPLLLSQLVFLLAIRNRSLTIVTYYMGFIFHIPTLSWSWQCGWFISRYHVHTLGRKKMVRLSRKEHVNSVSILFIKKTTNLTETLPSRLPFTCIGQNYGHMALASNKSVGDEHS